MTRIEFYVLPDDNPLGRLRAACQLAAKGWQHGLQVFVRCSDEDQSARLDELLWSFRAERFIPHEQYAEEVQAPVVIGLEQEPPTAQGLLINLAPTLGAYRPFQPCHRDRQPGAAAADRLPGEFSPVSAPGL